MRPVVVTEHTQPLYLRVSRRLEETIASGELGRGDRVPAERWLCREYSVSRATVRRALEELVREGLVEFRGRVPFVAGVQVAEPPNALLSFTEFGRLRGLRPTARVLGRRVRAATLDEAEAFGIAPGARVLDLRRLRMFDGLPFAIDGNRVPVRYLPDDLDIDFATASLYAVLESAGEQPSRADYEVEARIGRPEELGPLDLAPGAPVLCATTALLSAGGRVLDIGRTVYRADRYRFGATLMRRRYEEREGLV
jgi:GntR family transcriptional regulator